MTCLCSSHSASPSLVYLHFSHLCPKWLWANPGDLVWTRLQLGFYTKARKAIIIATVRASKWLSRREKARGACFRPSFRTPHVLERCCIICWVYWDSCRWEKAVSPEWRLNVSTHCCSLGPTPNPSAFYGFSFPTFFLALCILLSAITFPKQWLVWSTRTVI